MVVADVLEVAIDRSIWLISLGRLRKGTSLNRPTTPLNVVRMAARQAACWRLLSRIMVDSSRISQGGLWGTLECLEAGISSGLGEARHMTRGGLRPTLAFRHGWPPNQQNQPNGSALVELRVARRRHLTGQIDPSGNEFFPAQYD